MDIIITTLLVMGLQASILAVIIILFRGLFKKIPKGYIYVLWLVMLTRLVAPVIPESDYGITPSPDRLIISATAIVSPSTDMEQNQADVTPSTPNADASGTIDNNEVGNDTTTDNSTTGATTDSTTPALPFWQQAWFVPALSILWGAGTVAVLLITGIQYFSMKRKLQFAIRIEENIWECESVTSPFVMGVFQPRIYLPLYLPAEEQEYILSHEKMHIKHGDHITRLLMTLATAIHWWNPIVWLSMYLMKKDMEMLCDESATKSRDTEYRKSYSLTLLKYAARNSGLSPVLSFGESNTESRVKHLMFLKKPKFYVNLAMIFALCICLVGCMANGTIGGDTNTSDNTNENSAYKNPVQIPEETVTLTLYSDLSSYEGLQEGWFADVLLEKFNVKLDIIMSSTEPDENQYIGDYDIIISAGDVTGHFTEAVQKGHILELSNDIGTYMPYISKHLTDSYIRFPDISEDGIYAIPTSTSNPGAYEPSYMLWNLRFDYYEELGKPVISDLNDWVNILVQMHEKHPTTEAGKPVYATNIGYVTEGSDNGQMYEITHMVSGYYGYESIGMGFYDWKNHQYYDILSINEDGSYGPYLEMLKVYNTLYQKGLLYMDSTPDEGTEEEMNMLANGQYLTHMMYGATEYMYPVIPKEAKQLTYELGTIAHRRISIDSESQYPELAMAIIDYFYSPEGMLTMTYGPEKECWYYDANGKTCLTELGYRCYQDRDTLMADGKTFSSGMPMFNITPYNIMATNTSNDEPFDFTYWENVVAEPVNDVEAAWREWANADSIEKYMYDLDSCYTVPLSDSNYEVLDTSHEQVSKIITDKSWEAIKASTDTEFDAIVQDMINLATQAGYKECVEYSETYIKEQLKELK